MPVYSDSDPFGLDALVSQQPAIAAPKIKRQRRAASRRPKKPVVIMTNLFEGYDPVTGEVAVSQPAPTPAAEKMEDQEAGRPEQRKKNQPQQQPPTSQKPNPALPSSLQKTTSTLIPPALAQKAIPSPPTPLNTPPAAAKVTQPHSPIPQPNAPTLPAAIHELAD